MRRLTIAAATIAVLLASPAPGSATASSLSSLRSAFANNLNGDGGANGAYVVDLSTGKALYAYKQTFGRMPASVEKVYTTSTALLRFGPKTRLETRVYGVGSIDASGVWRGNLYLRGGGDPTFGSRSFDRSNYGTGATMQDLVSAFVDQTGVSAVVGKVIGDETYFDSLRGTAPYGYQDSEFIGGPLSALLYNAGLDAGGDFQSQPGLYAAQQFVAALQAAGVHVRASVGTGRTPRSAQQIASVGSPTIASLIRLTNVPSDNLFAEMLLKGLGARFGGRGSSAAGVAVVKAQLARFGVHPKLEDGSGLSRNDSTSPLQVVTVLRRMAGDPYFVHSLAVAGQSGTLQDRMVGTAAEGRCLGKTGTLYDVSALVGYCRAQDAHELAFAILQNYVDPDDAHPLQDAMAVAVAQYDG